MKTEAETERMGPQAEGLQGFREPPGAGRDKDGPSPTTEPPEGAQLCRQLDSRLPAPRMGKEYLCAALSPFKLVIICYGNHRKLIQLFT